MQIATWNVNSVKARMANVLEWLKEAKPDVVLLQEIKCETAAFPAFEFEALGYKSRALGQKTYNGVAILSLHAIEDVLEYLPEAGPLAVQGLASRAPNSQGEQTQSEAAYQSLSCENQKDTQARYIEATIRGIRVASIYLPNGNPQPGEKFDYKLAWMKRLHHHAAELLKSEKPVVLGGDYNIIPEAVDVYDPAAWEADALFHPKSRAAWREIVQLGYTEAFRALHPQQQHAYTFWDYQAGAWQRDAGLRIDHFLLSPEAADRLTRCIIDRTPRGKEKASDHTPVVVELAGVDFRPS